MISVREVVFQGEGYDQLVQLRREVLRLPLGLDFTPEQLAAEKDEIHLGLFEGDDLVACLQLVLKEPGKVKMRQVAVHPKRQGMGLGRKLVEASEQLARERGWTEIELHARETAVPFYLSLGYFIAKEPFEEVGIPHRFMAKKL